MRQQEGPIAVELPEAWHPRALPAAAALDLASARTAASSWMLQWAHADGTLEIIDWAQHMPVPAKAAPAREAVAA